MGCMATEGRTSARRLAYGDESWIEDQHEIQAQRTNAENKLDFSTYMKKRE